MYTQKFEVEDYLMFLKEISYAHQGCFYLIKNTVIVWNVITISILIYYKT